jgi:integrase
VGQTDLQAKPLRSELNSISRGVGFNLSNVAVEHVFVTIDEVHRLAALEIPDEDLALRRDQAGAALLYLSGMRAGAFSTLPIAASDNGVHSA